MDRRPFATTTHWLRLGGLCALALGIALLDTFTDREIAIGVFQVVVVLLAAGFLSTRGVTVTALGCALLVLCSYAATRTGDRDAGLVNCIISLMAIVAVAALALRLDAAKRAADAARTRLTQAGRLSQLGELAASIAHEVNQPLTAIAASGNACQRWLSNEPPQVERAVQAAQRVIDDAHRASAVIARVRGLVRQAEVAKDWLNVADTVEQVLDFIRGELAQRQVAVELQLQEGLPPLLADQSQLQQVVLNLLLNALDALEGVAPEARRLVVKVAQDTAGAIRLGVEDSGRGLTPGAREQMFEAFYTTKPQGMGLGLALSRSIVEAHGGRIWATSLPEGGTGVYCSLPKDQEP
ncbi:sensor histidine kinase [Pseudomonas sp. EpS/L25]|uniref:sensor histidine kinase n=1 Tax=Pseudomonas sp. EpS/L25 TaxID=1749078 RepID=UPI0007433938|nr:ATP-binding protein [Pseudomonas sp. EpS/L25]KUM33995.1 ATPase [Pseudomonas sp. EpS/L25]